MTNQLKRGAAPLATLTRLMNQVKQGAAPLATRSSPLVSVFSARRAASELARGGHLYLQRHGRSQRSLGSFSPRKDLITKLRRAPHQRVSSASEPSISLKSHQQLQLKRGIPQLQLGRAVACVTALPLDARARGGGSGQRRAAEPEAGVAGSRRCLQNELVATGGADGSRGGAQQPPDPPAAPVATAAAAGALRT